MISAIKYIQLILNPVVLLNAMESYDQNISENNKLIQENLEGKNIIEEKEEIVKENQNQKITNKNQINCCNKISGLLKLDNEEQTYNNLKKLLINIEQIKNNRNAIKMKFSFSDNTPIGMLKEYDPNKFTINIYNEEGEEIEEVLTNWFCKEIKNGDTLSSIKKSFLMDNKNSDPYSISFKINENKFKEKLKISIKYSDSNGEHKVEALYKNNPLFNIQEIFNDINEEIVKIIEEIKDKCYCQGIKNNKDGIKICFPKNENLLNKNLKEYFSITVEDKDKNEINEEVLSAWNINKKIKNGTNLSNIKSGFLTKFKNNKYNTESDPYSISMHIINSNYDKIRIRINYGNGDYFYIKHNSSEIIDIQKLTGSKIQDIIDTNKKDSSKTQNNDEYKEEVKKLFEKKIKCSKVANMKNSIKIIFDQNENLINNNNSNKFKLYILNEEGKVINEDIEKYPEDVVLMKWLKNEGIKSGENISNIKKLFLVRTNKYPTNNPFEISLKFKTNAHKKIKIKIEYEDLAEYVQLNESDIIELDKI